MVLVKKEERKIIKRFNGNSWQAVSSVRKWNGSSWQDTSVKRFDGSNWIKIFPMIQNLYHYGDLCSAISGGWIADIYYHKDLRYGTASFESNHLYTADLSGDYGNIGWRTKGKIDLTLYNFLHVLISVTTNVSGSYPNSIWFFTSTGTHPGYFENASIGLTAAINYTLEPKLYTNLEITLPISAVTGNNFVYFMPFSHAIGSYQIAVSIYRIWAD